MSDAILSAVPSARSVRARTRRARARRAEKSAFELVGEIYYVLISVALSIALAVGVANYLGEADTSGRASARALSGGDGALLAAVAGIGLLLTFATTLGPVGASPPMVAWWLTLPVDRRGLLRPTLLRAAVFAVAIGAVAGLLIAAVAGASSAGGLSVVGLGAGVGLFVVGAVAASQTFLRVRAAWFLVSQVILVAAPSIGIGIVLAGTGSERLPTTSYGNTSSITMVLALGGAALLVFADRRANKLLARNLAEHGAVLERLISAGASLDLREAALSATPGGRTKGRLHPRRWRFVQGPKSALVGADLRLLRRSPRALLGLLPIALFLGVAPFIDRLANPWLLGITLALGGFVAAGRGAGGARIAEMVPALDAAFPLGAKEVRALRCIAPTAAAAVPMVLAGTSLALLRGDPIFVLVALLFAPAAGAGAVRASYRPQPNWSGPLMVMPGGALPPGMVTALTRGLDITVLAAVPLVLALVIGPGTVLLFVQIALAAIALGVASMVPAVEGSSGSLTRAA